jgi:hypothetical protein
MGAGDDTAASRRWLCAVEALLCLDLFVLLGQAKRTKKKDIKAPSFCRFFIYPAFPKAGSNHVQLLEKEDNTARLAVSAYIEVTVPNSSKFSLN